IHSSNFQAGPLRMAYLTLLLRLRQLACHPALLPEEIRGSLTRSSKFDLVLEKLSEGTAEGHKILLFSQFTAILDLFEAALPERGITSVRLDGSTPLPERKKRVDAFQSEGPGSPSVFLASLKAGGVGLTLTRADYVFHYDPWWNPQVEAQASDRSHRIGQDKKVFVYRFLVRGTVEERVRILKESKKEIFDLLMNAQYDAPSDRITGTLSIGDMLDLLDFEAPSDEKD
ncbi:MAG: C-terminal helicase domain-containing protein, partial [Nitrospirota bacterium]|nr:C-terminal helicase domain-containing protein [Nitrospirota bacterium]